MKPASEEHSLLSIKEYLESRRGRVEEVLARELPVSTTEPPVIHEAMRYSTMAGGKRIRPILAIAAAEACGGEIQPLLQSFAALELIHTYSLIHDDLPALDNDDLRRGRKTSHVVFGEAMAILAGDALLTEAFSWLSEPVAGLDPARQLRAIRTVALAIDSKGMIGGQVADLQAERLEFQAGDEEAGRRLEFIHRNKTGALLTASVLVGGILSGASEEQLAHLETYGRASGLAFQIIDDLLDLEGSAESLGKTAGKDLEQQKLTWPAVFGVEESRRAAAVQLAAALHAAGMIGGPVNYLGAIAGFICERQN